MINIPHLDRKIWNPEYRAIEIIEELHKTGQAQIGIDGEGSDCSTLGLYNLLDTICEKFNFDPQTITIYTCNQLETHDRYRIVKHPPLYIPSGQTFARQHPAQDKNWSNIRHFGIFIGRSSWQRLWLASHLWKHYGKQTELTYHYDSAVDYHRTHLSFDELAYQLGIGTAVDVAADFMRQLPIKNETIDSYPILTPAHFAISKLYPNFFVEIVCETFLSGESFYPTEKTWRPFINRTPFLMLGSRNFLRNLKRLGFRTFSQWWDEGYDEDAGLDNGRLTINNIQDTIARLSAMPALELESMYNDMKGTLDHNFETFMNLQESDFKKIWP